MKILKYMKGAMSLVNIALNWEILNPIIAKNAIQIIPFQ